MFSSAQRALEWSFAQVERPIIHISSINHMRGPLPAGREENDLLARLTPYERHAQAACIIAMVEGLEDRASSQYLNARFGHALKAADVDIIMNRLFAALGTGARNRRAIYECMRLYFGVRVEPGRIRRLLGCSNAAAVLTKNRVFETMGALDARAMAEISDRLERCQIVRPSHLCAAGGLVLS